MNFEEIEQLKQLIASPKKIAIVSHRNPDGDAYGSSLALYHFLKKLDHTVTVISPNSCPPFLHWMPSQEEIVIFEKNIDAATKILNEAEIVFTLDFNAFHRAGEKTLSVLEKISPIFVMIDHHQSPDDYATYMYSDTAKSSTCEMIYDFFEMLGELDKIDVAIATCIYTGIMTDTGSFRFPVTTSRTHKITAHLLDLGADNAMIYSKIMDNNSLSRMKLLSKSLQNLTVIADYRTAYITLSQEELNQFNFEKGDTEGFVNYALSIKGIIFAAIFIEDKMQRIIKMSLRSKGTFSVNEFARNHFNGGGHTNAAGGKSNRTLQQTVDKFLNIITQYKTDLLNSYEA
jgi:phosphoesterase RecJ-like protein